MPSRSTLTIPPTRNDLSTRARQVTRQKSRHVKAAEQVTVVYRDDVLRIEAVEARSRVLGSSGSVEVTVQPPAGSRVEAKAASAELRRVGRLGNVAFEGAYGEEVAVKLDEAASIRLTTLAGDVSVGRLTGPGEISAQKGDIHVVEAAGGTLTLSTQQGDITVGAADGISASLDASTSYGRIHNALMNTDGARSLAVDRVPVPGRYVVAAGGDMGGDPHLMEWIGVCLDPIFVRNSRIRVSTGLSATGEADGAVGRANRGAICCHCARSANVSRRSTVLQHCLWLPCIRDRTYPPCKLNWAALTGGRGLSCRGPVALWASAVWRGGTSDAGTGSS